MTIQLPNNCPNWTQLEWSESRLVRAASRNQPFDVVDAPQRPGLYKLTWTNADNWDLAKKEIAVKASVRVQAPVLNFASLRQWDVNSRARDAIRYPSLPIPYRMLSYEHAATLS